MSGSPQGMPSCERRFPMTGSPWTTTLGAEGSTSNFVPHRTVRSSKPGGWAVDFLPSSRYNGSGCRYATSELEQKTPKKRGRKALILTQDQINQVEHLAALNMGIMDICRSLGISWSAFDKNRKKKQEINDALERGKAKGLTRATSKLMEKIEDGEFQAIQFYLKSADRERWAEKAEISHTLNLSEIISSANARIIEHQADALPSAREDIDIKQLNKATKS